MANGTNTHDLVDVSDRLEAQHVLSLEVRVNDVLLGARAAGCSALNI